LIADIVRHHPDFIYSTLIGDSRYAFVKAYQRLGQKNSNFHADRVPITDCSLSEPELLRIGPEASRGLIASSVYFQSIESDRNDRFIASYQARFGGDSLTSADSEASYISVLLLANAIRGAGTTGIDAIRRGAMASGIDAPQGRVTIDADNAHCYLTPRLARARDDRRFEIFDEAPVPVKPDPYLVWLGSEQDSEEVFPGRNGVEPADRRGRLRLVK
jgi:branched-chain amino acid transport system substrate-binding protein